MEVNSIKEIDTIIGNAFKTNKEIAVNQLEQIISKMPIEIKTLINDAFTLKRIPKEYLLSSILFSFSNACFMRYSLPKFHKVYKKKVYLDSSENLI